MTVSKTSDLGEGEDLRMSWKGPNHEARRFLLFGLTCLASGVAVVLSLGFIGWVLGIALLGGGFACLLQAAFTPQPHETLIVGPMGLVLKRQWPRVEDKSLAWKDFEDAALWTAPWSREVSLELHSDTQRLRFAQGLSEDEHLRILWVLTEKHRTFGEGRSKRAETSGRCR